MASIVLSAAGSALGAVTGLPFGATLGAGIGQALGGGFSASGNATLAPRFGPRLAELGVQTSTYGKMIPIVYGAMRLGGNIIWSQPIQETVTTSTSSASTGSGGKGGGGKISQTTTTYSYSVTLAIGICEGPLDQVLRIWADAEQLDLSQYVLRIYLGDEAQMPDTLMQAIDGAANTPAYRGLAYVIIENFSLADYGNRIPNFTFEVQKKALYPDYNGQTVEDMLQGMIMIPGAGEFVYDTTVEYKIPGVQVGSGWVQQGAQQAINMQNAAGEANALLALDQLQNTCPNIGWVGVVVSWFGTSMDAGSCTVLPGVEYQTGAITSPNSWSVGTYNRATAHQITLIGSAPQYGGTPDDGSILRYLAELRARGFKIMFYPLMFMDVSGKPWRGEMTGSPSDVSSFFTKTSGYNAFITHYANLVNGHVDAFVIGSELKGLTAVTDTPGSYPAVTQLVSLAATVKGIVGSGVTVTYAADWSEYHHTTGGWYNLDPLWASPNIDVIGIDAYFPLTNAPQDGYDVASVMAGWTSGEDYDFYFSDTARTVQVALTPPYAIKNIAWFWNNSHTNPNGATTGWVPNSKKIWFTEYGFPSVDGATNEPNVFYDPTSSDSAFPYFSQGRVDFQAQRVGHAATQAQWSGSAMVERLFAWTWDARPYAYWPDLTGIWTDGASWKTGHWLEGKLGISSLAAIVSDLCTRSGLATSDIDVSQIAEPVEGYIISSELTIRNALETLQQTYFFDTVESDNVLKFVPRGAASAITIPEIDLVPQQGKNSGNWFTITRAQEIELPQRVNIIYLNSLYNYQSAVQYAQRQVTSSMEILSLDLPVVLSDQLAKNIADITLFSGWTGRTSYQFDLPVKYAQLEPSDVVSVSESGFTHTMRITATTAQTPGVISVQAVAEDSSAYDFYLPPAISAPLLQPNPGLAVTQLELLDIAGFPSDDATTGALRLGAAGLSAGWQGAAVYRSDDNGADYNRLLDLASPATIGSASTVLAAGPSTVFDAANSVTIILTGNGQLQTVTQLAVLNGTNAAVLGNEIIQFMTATLVAPGQYTLSNLLRGRLGTEWAIGSHAAGETFVLLDGSISKQVMPATLLNLPRLYKPVTYGGTLSAATAESFTYSGVALKPYSPVHISGVRDGGGNLTISWMRRTRLNGQWQDGVDVPLNEASEAYEVDVLNGGAVVRTLTGLSSPTAAYTTMQQVVDFGSAQSSVSVNVYQLSAVVGRGYAGSAEL